MILACSARKTLEINQNHPFIEGLEPEKYIKEQKNS
jgi:hypothetical protein